MRDLLLHTTSVHWTLFCFCLTVPAQAQIQFEERGQASGIWTPFKAYGVSVSDYDRDGWDDILITGQQGVALFRNNADASFENVTAAAGLDVNAHYVVALFVDWDNDGDQDLFLGRRTGTDKNRVYRNDDGIFIDITESAGVDSAVSIGSAAASDYDNDGLADLYLSTRGTSDQLYRNISAGSVIRFQDVSGISGMGGLSYSIGMQPTWIDVDQDGDQDMFVVHDGFDLSRLHLNDGALPFPNIASPMDIAEVGAGNSMGVSWGDVDNDGWQDVYVSRIDSGGLYRNTSGGAFQEVAAAVGADSNGMTWGVVFADLDNDGWEDLPMVNISSFGGTHPASLLYYNLGGSFIDIGAESGFRTVQDFYGLASGDFDNDGRVDLVAASDFPAGQNRLWMNRTESGNHWIRLRLEAPVGTNSMGIGTRVRAVTSSGTYVRSVFAGSSYCSQISPVVHIGLADAATVDTLEIYWKVGEKDVFTGLVADSLYDIRRTGTTAAKSGPEDSEVPEEVTIAGVYPNPFNGETVLRIRSARAAIVTITIVDVLGREHQRMDVMWSVPGERNVRVDAGGLASGVYYAVVSGMTSVSVPLVLVR